MTDTKIITEHELNYIETLYLSCNLEDFISMLEFNDYDLNIDIVPHRAYTLMMDIVIDHLIIEAEYLGESKGRVWYRFLDYRIGIMPYDRAKKANQYNCVIQYEQHYMFTLNKNLDGIKLPFNGDRSQYKIKRIDVTKIAKHKADYIENHWFISPYRKVRYEQGTIYLGHRNNGNVFRLYNKTKELLDTENDRKIELLTKYFGDIENLWTYELELSRSYLKENLNIDTLADLDKVYLAYKNIVGQIRIYDNNDRNKKLVAQGKRERIKAFVLSDFEEYERVEKKKYDPSFDYLINGMKKRIKKFYENMEIELSPSEFIRIVSALSEGVDFEGKELTINFENSDIEVEKAQMTAKHERIRASQGNDLEIESKRYFGVQKKLLPVIEEIPVIIPFLPSQIEFELTYT